MVTGAALALGALVAPAVAATPGPGPRLAVRTAPAAPRSHPDVPVTRMIVRMKDGGAVTATVRAAGGRAGLGSARDLRRTGTGARLLELPHALSPAAAQALARTLSARPDVAYAAPDVRMYATSTPLDPGFVQWDLQDTTTPTGYGSNAPSLWSRTTGSPSVVVAVLDTGITAHPALDSHLVPGYDFISLDDVSSTTTVDLRDAVANDGDGRDANPTDPGDFITADDNSGATYNGYLQGCADPNNPGATENSSWHGTHVTGTIVASQISYNGSIVGTRGVAPGVLVEPVRVLGRCGGSSADIADAIVWASGGHIDGVPDNAHPAAVVSLSLGGGGACDPATQAAIGSARSRGTTVVVAAGNSGTSFVPDGSSSGSNPADCHGVIDVTAASRAGGLASYSNYGTVAGNLTIAAQGGDFDSGDGSGAVWSTLNAGTTIPTGPAYAGYLGTSMATPHVSAAVALLQSLRRTRAAYTPDQIAAILPTLTQHFSSAATCSALCGVGILDLSRPAPVQEPTAVTGATLTRNGTNAAATWVPSTDSDGLPTTYTVQTSPDSATWSAPATVTATTQANLPLLAGRTLYARITPSNTGGSGPSSVVGPLVVNGLVLGGSVSSATLYPARDGWKDSVTFSFGSDLTTSGTLVIMRSTSTIDIPVRHIPLPQGTGWAVAWDGRDDSGRLLPEGDGVPYFAAPDLIGTTSPFFGSVSIQRSVAKRSVIFRSIKTVYPIKDRNRDYVRMWTSQTVPTVQTWRIYRGKKLVWAHVYPRAINPIVAWGGRDARGRRLPAGLYGVVVVAQGAEGPAVASATAVALSYKKPPKA